MVERLVSRARRPLAAGLVALVCLCVAGDVVARETAPGAIRGSVYDTDFEVPLSGVRVIVLGTTLTTITGPDGNFVLSAVPAGAHTLIFTKDGFERRIVPGVTVNAGQMTTVRADLVSEVVEMDELVVTGTDLFTNSDIGSLEIRAEAVAVQDAISSETLSKAGVSDVAGALKLVVGASVTGGKYAVVRGLSDRYTGTTLNGLRIPSADPRRRAVQLDLFPTGTIESITVTKTFTPDQPGDFTGGGIDIRTRSIPEQFFAAGSISLEHNSNATGNDDFLTYPGGGSDTWGFETGDRGPPDEAREPLPAFPRFSLTPSAADLEASKSYDEVTRSFSPVMGVSPGGPGPNYGFSMSAGTRFGEQEGEEDGPVFGMIGALTYTHKYDFYEGGENNNAVVSDPSQPITLEKERTDTRGIDEVLVGALGSFVLKPDKNNEISLKLIRNQSAEDEARLQVQETGPMSVEQNQSLTYTERVVGANQLRGHHLLPGVGDLVVDWVTAYNFTKQEEPDVRFFRNTFDIATLSARMPANSTDAQNTRRIFRDIDENNIELGTDATLPLTQWTESLGTFKSGLYSERSKRDYQQESYTYRFSNQFGSFRNPDVAENLSRSQYNASGPHDLWTDVFNNDRRLGLATNTPPAPNQLLWIITALGDDVDYKGEERISAGYSMIDLPLHPKLRLVAGARYESTEISIEPENDAFGTVEVIVVLPGSGDRAIEEVDQEEAQADIHQGETLPSINLVYEIVPTMNLRASATRTIARPTFRELAPVATEEFIFGDEFIGNPELTLSTITNYDLRWEWFRQSGEVFSASLFYKDIRDPIELISFSAGGRSFVQPVNFEHGRVLGLEVEARASLEPLWSGLKGLNGGINATLIDSEVDVPEEEQESLASFGLDESTRRLQGQPSYLLNISFSYDNDRLGTSAALFYNLVGETLVTGAARGAQDGSPNVFEQPFATLDLSVTQRIAGQLSVAFKAKNLLGQERRSVYRTPEGEEAVKSSRDTPVLFSLALTASW